MKAYGTGARRPQTTAWRFLPAGMIAWLAITVLVNAAMIYFAMNTFPGAAHENAFDVSNRYDAVMAKADREASLGWSVTAEAIDAHPQVKLSGLDVSVVPLAKVTGSASRPVGPEQATPISFTYISGPRPRFSSQSLLPGKGQWDLSLTVEQAGRVFHATRRVVVR